MSQISYLEHVLVLWEKWVKINRLSPTTSVGRRSRPWLGTVHCEGRRTSILFGVSHYFMARCEHLSTGRRKGPDWKAVFFF